MISERLHQHAPPPAERGGDLVVFEVAGHRYALPVTRVHEIAPRAALTPLPGAPAALAGVLRLRGGLLPIVDLRVRLGRPAVAPRISHRIVVALVGRSGVGFLVDAVHGLVTLAAGTDQESVDSTQLICRIVETADGVLTVLNAGAAVGAEVAAFYAGIADRVAGGDVRERTNPAPEGAQ